MTDPAPKAHAPRRNRRLGLAVAALAIVALAWCVMHRQTATRWLRVWAVQRAQRSATRRLIAAGRLPRGVVVVTRAPSLWLSRDRLVRVRDGAEMVLVPAGEFLMGTDTPAVESDDEGPARRVYLDAYLIDKFEVTNEQFKRFVDAVPEWGPTSAKARATTARYLEYWRDRAYPPEQANHPVHHVSWEAAAAYAAWAGASLPTEAQWEKAARGGLEAKRFPWGDEIDPRMANWGRIRWPHMRPGHPVEPRDFVGAKFDNPGTTPVGSFPPNAYGLYDVAGNVWEWCADWYHPRYHRYAPTRNPGAVARPIMFNFIGWGVMVSARAARGGSWYRRPLLCRCANRSYDHFASPLAELTDYYYGFRCVVAVGE